MKHRGRGLAAIEYPTGMNQGGDPSQAWIKMKPDGRVDVFAGTVDIGQGSKTVHTQIVADTLGVPYDWVTMDVSNTDSSPLCTGTFASRGTFIGGNAVAVAATKAQGEAARGRRPGSWRSTRPTSRSSTARSWPRACPTRRCRSRTSRAAPRGSSAT